ncbi:hypothetical protein DID75_02035 [Candidatus Marinamargulisbacteria bacterium SCGC AG-410-N11]|nr:hypothetical protein DID75_02035 [Candidatus Marinamargulisbacteria bacterium SCGC AG-410-N11]
MKQLIKTPLKEIMEIKKYTKDTILIKKNINPKCIFQIISGTANVIIDNKIITTLSKNNIIGELSFFSDSLPTATVKLSSQSKIAILPQASLYQHKNRHHLESILTKICFIQNKNNLSKSNNAIIEFMEEKVFYSSFFSLLLFLIIANIACTYYMTKHMIDHTSLLWSIGGLSIYILPTILLIFYNKKTKLSTFGINTNHWKQSIRDGLIISLITISISLPILIYFDIDIIENIKTYLKNKSNSNLSTFLLIGLKYSIHVLFQEFVGRGVIFETMLKIGKNTFLWKTWAILISSILFSIIHIYFGPIALTATFIGSILFSITYLKYRNIISCSIIHTILGILFFICLEGILN